MGLADQILAINITHTTYYQLHNTFFYSQAWQLASVVSRQPRRLPREGPELWTGEGKEKRGWGKLVGAVGVV